MAPRRQAARSRAPGPRRKAAAERPAGGGDPAAEDQQPAAVSVSAYRPHLDAAEEERLGKLVIAAASRISDRLGGLGGLGNMVSWLARTHN